MDLFLINNELNMSKELKEFLEDQSYFNIKEIPNKGICALYRFAFTTGLVYDINEIGYKGRYCYSNKSDAVKAIEEWNGESDPQDENWIKHKGESGEYKNPLS